MTCEGFELSARGKLKQAIKSAFWTVAGTAMWAPAAYAQEETPPPPPAPELTEPAAPPPATGETTVLETLEVTGSRLRRVDMENANPVFVIDRAMIEASGVTTVGELIQELPSIRGNAINPQVNNGGGDGASEVSLRGLGEDRTLLLLNGRRLVTQDVNAIPINLIERVDVLNEGASAIYGSDAVAGVVNFITRKSYNGGEAAYDYGISTKNDGKRQSISLSMGTGTGRANVMLGVNYNTQDGISSADRSFAENALYLYGGVVSAAGSSRNPNGRIFLDAVDFADEFPDCTPSGGEISVVRNDGAVGDSFDDYHCFSGADAYNFQPLNLVLTPQERAGLFTVANFAINDDLEAYTEMFYNRTSSGYQIAPLPFDAVNDQVILSADSVYNPFGIDFGGPGDLDNPNFLTRLEFLGNRRNKVETDTSQINLGLRGDLLDTGWRWDVVGTYGHISQKIDTSGYLYQPLLSNGLGPSFDADPAPGIQDPRCGTPGNEIAGCTPINFFNLTDPDSQAALDLLTASYSNSSTQGLRSLGANFNGDIFRLPAGAVSAAVGAEYRAERLKSKVDFIATALPPDYLNCYISQEACSTPTDGEYKVTEYYGEVLVPVMADQPGAEALNLILGLRHSNYSHFGKTTNGKVAVEYRPVKDLLTRLSYSEVFRAPTIVDLYSPPAANAPTFNDPCTGLTSAQLAGNPNLALACENVDPDTGFAPANSQITGLLQGNPDLDPETGEVLTFGVVYDPEWLDGFSTKIDFWIYELEDTIESLDVNTIAEQCVATGDPTFCGYIQRFPNGQVNVIDQPTANLGAIEAEGVDIGFKYAFDRLPGLGDNAQVGRFRASLDTTYVDKYDRTADQNFPDQVTHLAGTFDRQDGNFSRVKSKFGLQWNLAAFEALWTADYIGPFKISDPDGAPGTQPTRSWGSHTYHDFAFGYNLPVWTTKLQVGINNAFDKQPPILFQNNVLNANTDVETFDTIGSFWWARVTKTF